MTCDAENQFFVHVSNESQKLATKKRNIDIGRERELSLMMFGVIQAIKMIIM